MRIFKRYIFAGGAVHWRIVTRFDLLIGTCSSQVIRSEEHTSELQSRENLVCRLLLEKKKRTKDRNIGHLAEMLTAVGIDLKQGRIVAAAQAAICEAVNPLRPLHNDVFTTGVIRHTHN